MRYSFILYTWHSYVQLIIPISFPIDFIRLYDAGRMIFQECALYYTKNNKEPNIPFPFRQRNEIEFIEESYGFTEGEKEDLEARIEKKYKRRLDT